MASSLTAALSKVVKEEIPRGIREQRIKIDPVWSTIISTSMGVTREGLGRDWKFLLTYESGISGAYQFEDNTILTGAATTAIGVDSAQQFGAPNTFPGRTETTAPAFHQRTVQLKEARGNLFVPIKWLQLDEFDASIGSAVRSLMRGTSRKAALAHAMAFYTKDASDFRIVDNLQTSTSATSHTITIDNSDTTKASGRIQMLHNGQTVDLYGSDDVRDNTTGPWVVHDVDYINNKFKISSLGDAARALGGSNTTYLTLRNSGSNVVGTEDSHQPSGLNSWIKDASLASSGGTTAADVIFGINIADHPEFGSLVVAETGPATEKMLNKHVGTFLDRVGTLAECDTQISSAGVVHSYLENEDNLARYERNGRRLTVSAGWTDIDYAYQGEALKWAISSFVQPGTIFIIKTGGNNIKEYVPPTTPGAGRKAEFDNEFQFVAQLGGATGVFLHERVNSNVGDQLEAPFFRICELAPDQCQSIKITGLDESGTN